MKKIVLTGGPCGGKSSAKKYLEGFLKNADFLPIFVSETATIFNSAGLSVANGLATENYQKYLLSYQINTEDHFIALAKTMNTDKIVFVFDRGAMDGKAYLTDDQFDNILMELNIKETELLKRYDGIFHLNSTVKGAKDYYRTGDGTCRKETPQQALVLDDRTWTVWNDHPCHVRIENCSDFKDKMNHLGEAIIKIINGTE